MQPPPPLFPSHPPPVPPTLPPQTTPPVPLPLCEPTHASCNPAPPLSLQGPGSPAPSGSEPETRLLPFQNSDNNRDAENNNYHRYREGAPPSGQRSVPPLPRCPGPSEPTVAPYGCLGPPRPTQAPNQPLKTAPGPQSLLGPSQPPLTPRNPPAPSISPSRLPWAPQVPQARPGTHHQPLTALLGPQSPPSIPHSCPRPSDPSSTPHGYPGAPRPSRPAPKATLSHSWLPLGPPGPLQSPRSAPQGCPGPQTNRQPLTAAPNPPQNIL